MVKAVPYILNILCLSILPHDLRFANANGGFSADCPSKCVCREATTVECNYQNLTAIPTNLLKSVEILDLSDNQIGSLPDNLFASTPCLKILDLRKNRFERIPPAIGRLKRISRLDLRLNRIGVVEKLDLQRIILANVEFLDLTRNDIREWPLFFGGADYSGGSSSKSSRLVKLNLSANKLTNLRPNNFAAFRNLIWLKLSRNEIERFEKDAFNGLGSLRFLDISSNHIPAIGALSLQLTPRLEYLNLAENRLTVIEAGAFHGMERLQVLNVSGNRLNPSGFSDGGFYGLSSLYRLDLSSNTFYWVDLSLWNYVPTVQWLSLADNRLQELPANAFHRLVRLRLLLLGNNRIETIHRRAFNGLELLEELDLSHNLLAPLVEDASTLNNCSLPALRRLNLSANNIRVVPPGAFHTLRKSLTWLDLDGNEIVAVAERAFDELKLERIALNTSSLLCDCSAKYFAEWLIARKGAVGQEDRIRVVCRAPTSFRGKKLSASKLTCDGSLSRLAKITENPPALLKAEVGSYALLNCSASGARPLTLCWRMLKANGVAVQLTDKLDTVLTLEYGDSTTLTVDGEDFEIEQLTSRLRLRDVGATHQAEYQCVVANGWSADYSQLVSVVVEKRPELIRTPTNYTALHRHNAVFTCSATGIPTPIITWEKDERADFPAAVERRLHIRDDDDILYLLNVTNMDAGRYTCRANNAAGTVEASAFLTVFESAFRTPPNLVFNPITQTATVEAVARKVVVVDCSTDIAAVADGSSITFFINWYHNDRLMHFDPMDGGGSRISIRAQNQLLVIQRVTFADSGTYVCELFVNQQFLSRQNFRLVVLPSSSSATTGNRNKKPGARSPRGEYATMLIGDHVWTTLVVAASILAGFILAVAVLCSLRCRRNTNVSGDPTTRKESDEEEASPLKTLSNSDGKKGRRSVEAPPPLDDGNICRGNSDIRSSKGGDSKKALLNGGD